MLGKISTWIFMLVISASIEISAQTVNVTDVLDTASIEQQFKTLFDRSSRYEEYKVIREAWLNKYQKNLNDTVQSYRKSIAENKTIIAEKNKEIESLNSNLTSVNSDLENAIKEKNSLRFLGINMDKTLYNLIMWIIIAGLLFLLIVIFLMHKRSQSVTRETVSTLDQLRSEYDDYRNQSRIKMEKIKREHLDEILKLKSGQ